MNIQDISESACLFINNSKDNTISLQNGISENVVEIRIFEEPIFAFSSAEDEYFKLLKRPSAIGEHFLLPKEWLPEAKTVISFFLPFSEDVKVGNKRDMLWPSEEWLYGRIEGQALLTKLCFHLKSELDQEGYSSMIPSQDARFWSESICDPESQHPDVSYTSNWSERHIAFICGLGTFGLSRGLITRKGICGRFGSIITELDLQSSKREYTGIYEYCLMCGSCANNCPVNAISIENGKDHTKCSNFLEKTKFKFKPRYGCGKCQIGTPCESKIPNTYGQI